MQCDFCHKIIEPEELTYMVRKRYRLCGPDAVRQMDIRNGIANANKPKGK